MRMDGTPRRGCILSEAKEEEIVRRYTDTTIRVTQKDLARRFGVGESRINHILKRRGAVRKRALLPSALLREHVLRYRLSAEDQEEVVRRYTDPTARATQVVLAKQFDVSQASIHRVLKRRGVLTPGTPQVGLRQR